MMMMMMDDDSFEISFAGEMAVFLFGRCCNPDWGFLVILGIFLIKWEIAKDCILYDKIALKLSYGANDNELFCTY